MLRIFLKLVFLLTDIILLDSEKLKYETIGSLYYILPVIVSDFY